MDQPGLRERKKAETRRTIAQVALRLFAERGFDAVTVADVAAAANVSTKTVFNYFAVKEALVLGDGDELEREVLGELEARPAGESVLEAIRRHTLATARRMRETPAAQREAFRAVVLGAPSVQAFWRERQRLHEVKLAAMLAADTKASHDDARPFIVASILNLLGRLAYYDVIGWPDGKRRSARKTDEAIEHAFDLLASGLNDYATRPKQR